MTSKVVVADSIPESSDTRRRRWTNAAIEASHNPGKAVRVAQDVPYNIILGLYKRFHYRGETVEGGTVHVAMRHSSVNRAGDRIGDVWMVWTSQEQEDQEDK